ncbi:hypothetical protein [Amycolatopsis regifaucium]|uniref:Uncharacterized protein n=1 Tax=Amycolatopsis regifaucium TaxID=546365 RepID=A0A154MSD0_9PSEU|nr:hypothetical protein [Amycolatopsis regifaucium]KZB87010.1 hypothetical protein AVL48_25490 [Amycolatopsis regifaucium]OKA09660.1 hypothetical protein ATP06_0208050 [Amycolatopsis regifaucium]
MFDARIVADQVDTATRPKIRILFYTDLVGLSGNNGFALGILRELIVGNQPFFAQFEVELINRHEGGHAVNKLTADVLGRYEQVWFFGLLQCNMPGEPENELVDAEVAALRSWMDAGGGVFVSGDHSNPRPAGADPSLPDYLNLGRALGHRIPRAGELRVWNDRPDSSVEFSHNTHQPDPWGSDIDMPIPNDLDPYPQELILRKRAGRPHALFQGRRGPITVFPDHMHEGQLLIPERYPEDVWPTGRTGQPKPEIVARGTDKRNGQVYGVSSVYDGAAAGVGRIVADSTWHHYFDLNLWGFQKGGEVLDRLTEYYVNLVLWLTPKPVKQEVNTRLLHWLSHSLSVRAVLPEGFRVPGITAAGLVREVGGQGVLDDLVRPLEGAPRVPEDLLLGAVVKESVAALSGGDVEAFDTVGVVERGLRAGTEQYAAELRAALDELDGMDEFISQGLR